MAILLTAVTIMACSGLTAFVSLRAADGTPEENRIEASGSAVLVLAGSIATGALSVLVYAVTA